MHEGFVYDDQHIVMRFDGDQAEDLTNRYLHGPTIDQILADEQVHYDTDDYVTDHIYWPLGNKGGQATLFDRQILSLF